MGTTTNGYPYPEDTDPVAQGAQGIRSLASAIDTKAGISAAGKVNVTLNNVITESTTEKYKASEARKGVGSCSLPPSPGPIPF